MNQSLFNFTEVEAANLFNVEREELNALILNLQNDLRVVSVEQAEYIRNLIARVVDHCLDSIATAACQNIESEIEGAESNSFETAYSYQLTKAAIVLSQNRFLPGNSFRGLEYRSKDNKTLNKLALLDLLEDRNPSPEEYLTYITKFKEVPLTPKAAMVIDDGEIDLKNYLPYRILPQFESPEEFDELEAEEFDELEAEESEDKKERRLIDWNVTGEEESEAAKEKKFAAAKIKYAILTGEKDLLTKLLLFGITVGLATGAIIAALGIGLTYIGVPSLLVGIGLFVCLIIFILHPNASMDKTAVKKFID